MAEITNLSAIRSIKNAEKLLTFYKIMVDRASADEVRDLTDQWERESLIHPSHILTILKGRYLTQRMLSLVSIASPDRIRAEEAASNLEYALEAYKGGLF